MKGLLTTLPYLHMVHAFRRLWQTHPLTRVHDNIDIITTFALKHHLQHHGTKDEEYDGHC